jgi:hypothetical protein
MRWVSTWRTGMPCAWKKGVSRNVEDRRRRKRGTIATPEIEGLTIDTVEYGNGGGLFRSRSG